MVPVKHVEGKERFVVRETANEKRHVPYSKRVQDKGTTSRQSNTNRNKKLHRSTENTGDARRLSR
jgi:hypothetical protein